MSKTGVMILLLFVFVGCGDDDEDVSSDQNGTAATPATEGTSEDPQRTGVGAGYSGRGEGYGGGLIGAPIRHLFRSEDTLVKIQIRQLIDIYKILNGSLPQTTEEFMKEIIEANGIRLADPPEGQHYVWDPEADDGEGHIGWIFLERIAEE